VETDDHQRAGDDSERRDLSNLRHAVNGLSQGSFLRERCAERNELSDRGGSQTGRRSVFYAAHTTTRTMGVATGTATVSTVFRYRRMMESGLSDWKLFANGMPPQTAVNVTLYTFLPASRARVRLDAVPNATFCDRPGRAQSRFGSISATCRGTSFYSARKATDLTPETTPFTLFAYGEWFADERVAGLRAALVGVQPQIWYYTDYYVLPAPSPVPGRNGEPTAPGTTFAGRRPRSPGPKALCVADLADSGTHDSAGRQIYSATTRPATALVADPSATNMPCSALWSLTSSAGPTRTQLHGGGAHSGGDDRPRPGATFPGRRVTFTWSSGLRHRRRCGSMWARHPAAEPV